MSRKIALKRLTRSDLTIFEYHFRNGNAGNQKSININRNIIEGEFYPNLTEVAEEREWEPFILNLTILGPGPSTPQVLPQKIIKGGTYKNWRLNGKLIPSPENEERYASLQAGDYAILEFIGAAWPTSMRMTLVAQGHDEDRALHESLSESYSEASMVSLDLAELEMIVELLQGVIPATHPIKDLLDSFDLEDAAQGGIHGIESLLDRRRARGVSHEELRKAKKAAESIGRQGEEILDQYFANQQKTGEIEDYRWVANENAISPFDFDRWQKGTRQLIDAKSTAGPFHNQLHISLAELKEMATSKDEYFLYRLYEVKNGFARLRQSGPMRYVARSLLKHFDSPPYCVQIDSISINPEELHFSDETIIDLYHHLDQA
ncbi:protein NO VEIN domain-containing protein [Halomonas urumqiensis]|uniref:Uncharacterized protein n=1 Tax=Halomonas urumqiensis TaxID=1684789 RepID=A0A2N7UDH5_9GAMM|nr:DUF3883 domain-containing protein [Halomonas urumqiensis]PMR78516.1 hypothetical protein C1H70_17390 [Halomonas urumqiensis]PTB03661.1 DUF3883 domain-containing protein [Halomonas urumqiensis]GHE20128.1 hypothetical protein GCM10017767_06490 [Halomonas urumqiensis]